MLSWSPLCSPLATSMPLYSVQLYSTSIGGKWGRGTVCPPLLYATFYHWPTPGHLAPVHYLCGLQKLLLYSAALYSNTGTRHAMASRGDSHIVIWINLRTVYRLSTVCCLRLFNIIFLYLFRNGPKKDGWTSTSSKPNETESFFLILALGMSIW